MSSTFSMTVSAHNPCRTAFRRDWRLPSSVLGPVLLMALRRLASIRRNEVMGWRARQHYAIKLFLHGWQDQAWRRVVSLWRRGRSFGPPEPGSPPKAPLPSRARRSAGWSTTPFHCHDDAAHDGARGTTA